MSDKTIGFVGGGRITRILLKGWAKAGKLPAQIVVSDPDSKSLRRLTDDFPAVRAAGADNTVPAGQEIVILAIHPPAMAEVLARIKAALKPDAILISLAPKLTVGKLSGMLDGFSRIARIIPNAPSIVGRGYNPVAFANALTESDRSEVTDLMKPLGEVPQVAENTLEVYAILTAMGPTYLWPQLYELQSLAQSFGLDIEAASAGLAGMVQGALATMGDSALTPEEVQDLIPVKPLADLQPALLDEYRTKLGGVMEKIRP